MKTNFVLWILLLLSRTLFAQSDFEIRGRILDRKSGEPLPNATISLAVHSGGTLSNDLGAFAFFVPAGYGNDTLLISFMGYATLRQPLSYRVHSTVEFFLEPAPIVLKEVAISGDGARKLVEEAIRAIPVVCPTEPFLMEGFHRSWEKVDFTDSVSHPGTLIEAAVTIYDPGYGPKNSKNKGLEEIYINEIRRSAITEGWNHQTNGLQSLLDKNLVKHNKTAAWIFLKSFLDFPNKLIYEWEGTTTINEENVSIVSVEVPNAQQVPSHYLVYISDDDHAILRFDLLAAKNNIDYELSPWHTQNFKETFTFRRYKQKLYLSYIKRQFTIKNLDQVRKKVLRTEDYSTELMINNVITTEVDSKRHALSAKKSKKVSLALQVNEIHPEFWKNYNMILENPLDQSIIAFFEQISKKDSAQRSRKNRK